MITAGIQQVKSRILHCDALTQIAVLGDPGCDGLGAETMRIFAEALRAADGADFSLIAGDAVPDGKGRFYQSVCHLVDALASNPVYLLKGNHDKGAYADFFGRDVYLIESPDTAFLVLNNAGRTFSPESLALLEETLADYARPNLILCFHIPPPNPISTNALAPSVWREITDRLVDFAGKVTFICGHVHSYFEADLPEGRLIVTGGSGARIEYVSDKVPPGLIDHHIVRLEKHDNVWRHKRVTLLCECYTPELKNAALQSSVETAFSNELHARFNYMRMSEKADMLGFAHTARALRAMADAEEIHARNLAAQQQSGAERLETELRAALAGERDEYNRFYRELVEQAEAQHAPVSAYAFHDAREAERVHAQILAEIIESVEAGRDIPEGTYRTCTSCGYTFAPGSTAERCPVCGAPKDKIRTVN